MKKRLFKLAALTLIIIPPLWVNPQKVKAVEEEPTCGYELNVGGLVVWVDCKDLWCANGYFYGGCSASGNGPVCTTKKSCPAE